MHAYVGLSNDMIIIDSENEINPIFAKKKSKQQNYCSALTNNCKCLELINAEYLNPNLEKCTSDSEN